MQTRPLQPLGRTATVVTAALASVILADLMALYSGLLITRYLQDILQGRPTSESSADTIAGLTEAAGRFQTFALLFTFLTFLFWFYRAQRNLHRAGLPDLTYGPGWTVGSFFIPLLNAFIPYLVMGELWRGSQGLAEGPPYNGTWSRTRTSPLVGLWWLTVILTFGVGRLIRDPLMSKAENARQFLDAAYVGLGFNLSRIAAAALAIAVVRTVTYLQDTAHTEVPGTLVGRPANHVGV